MSTVDPLAKLRVLTMSEVADLLVVSERKLYRMIAEGAFPRPIKVGSAARVLLVDLEQYIEGQRQQRGNP